MFCKFCGEKIDNDSIFCKFCGKKLPIQEKKKDNNNIKVPIFVNHLKRTILIPSRKGTSTTDFKITTFLMLFEVEPSKNDIDFKTSEILIESSGKNILDFDKIDDIILEGDDKLVLIIKYKTANKFNAVWGS